MFNKPKISVITPSFNKEGYILDCIKSVVAQGDKVYEHLIIDGLSTDDTMKIVKENWHSKLKLISERDEGQSDALNKGIENSAGDIICWLNADDVLYPNIFDEIWSDLISDDWDLLYGGLDIINESGRIIYTQNSFPFRNICENIMIG